MVHRHINIIQTLFTAVCTVLSHINKIQTLFTVIYMIQRAINIIQPLFTVTKGIMLHRPINIVQALFTAAWMVQSRINKIQTLFTMTYMIQRVIIQPLFTVTKGIRKHLPINIIQTHFSDLHCTTSYQHNPSYFYKDLRHIVYRPITFHVAIKSECKFYVQPT